MPLALPPLPYPYGALEPTIDELTMRIHHDKHHGGYVAALNAALEGTAWADRPVEELLGDLDALPGDTRPLVRNNGGGHLNHSLFWESMAAVDHGLPPDPLADSGIAVMLLTTTEHDERILATLRAGARGLVLKDTEPAELVRAIELLARGDALLSPSLTRRLIAELGSIPDPQLPSSELLDELTPREREVVGLVALGLSNAAIAERLVISPATSKTHVSRAMLKLGAHDRAQLVVFAFHAGLAVPRAETAAPHALVLEGVS